VAGIGLLRQVTHLTTACTRPADTLPVICFHVAGGRVMPGVRLLPSVSETSVNQKQMERWEKSRAKGELRFVLRAVTFSALCAVAGHVIWGLSMLVWRGDAVPYFMREPGSVLAMAAGFAFAGYLQSSREWRRNEREYHATESEIRSGAGA
jgi:hypothetical protein